MSQLLQLLHKDPVQAMIILWGIQYTIGVATDCLDPPSMNSGPGYKFLYKFAHGIAGNWSRMKPPGQGHAFNPANEERKP